MRKHAYKCGNFVVHPFADLPHVSLRITWASLSASCKTLLGKKCSLWSLLLAFGAADFWFFSWPWECYSPASAPSVLSFLLLFCGSLASGFRATVVPLGGWIPVLPSCIKPSSSSPHFRSPMLPALLSRCYTIWLMPTVVHGRCSSPVWWMLGLACHDRLAWGSWQSSCLYFPNSRITSKQLDPFWVISKHSKGVCFVNWHADLSTRYCLYSSLHSWLPPSSLSLTCRPNCSPSPASCSREHTVSLCSLFQWSKSSLVCINPSIFSQSFSVEGEVWKRRT